MLNLVNKKRAYMLSNLKASISFRRKPILTQKLLGNSPKVSKLEKNKNQGKIQML